MKKKIAVLMFGSMLTFTSCGKSESEHPKAEEVTVNAVGETTDDTSVTVNAAGLSYRLFETYRFVEEKTGGKSVSEETFNEIISAPVLSADEMRAVIENFDDFPNVKKDYAPDSVSSADTKRGMIYSFDFDCISIQICDNGDSLSWTYNFTSGESVAIAEDKEPPRTLDEAISQTIITREKPHFSEGECSGEGHIILDSEETEQEGVKKVTAYTLSMFGTYEFEDGNFVKNAGSGATPTVFKFTVNAEGIYEPEDYKTPMDGAGYKESIKEMFPKNLWDSCLFISDEQRETLKKQERAYAEAYLKEIGRDAKIGDYGDFEHKLLTDEGISVEVSNMMSGNAALYAYPFWIGNIEKIEDGVRYRYSQELDKANGLIICKKLNTDNNETAECFTFDAKNGKQR